MNMKKAVNYIIILILLLLILGAIGFLVKKEFFKKWTQTNNVSTQTQSDQAKFASNISSFLNSGNPDVNNIITLMDTWDVKWSISAIESLLSSWDLTPEQKQALESLLISNYLTYGSIYYKEAENSQKARDLLEQSGISKQTWFYNYYMGYSYEIENNFDTALSYYNVAVNYGTQDRKAQTYNQIGHVYDLQWDLDEAMIYYNKSYAIDDTNLQTNLNLWRAYTRKWDFEQAKKYFEYVVSNTKNTVLQSEVYFNLSTLSFFTDSDLDKSIELAKKSIESNPDYPLAYVWVARGFLEKWEANLDAKEALDKAVSLYPNLSSWYKYLWIYSYMNSDFDNAVVNFEKYAEASKTDITLMWNYRKLNYNEALYFLVRTYAQQSNAEKSMEKLNEILETWDTQFKVKFIEDINIEEGPLENIKNEAIVIETLETILLEYTK